jgi:hypothetical protein
MSLPKSARGLLQLIMLGLSVAGLVLMGLKGTLNIYRPRVGELDKGVRLDIDTLQQRDFVVLTITQEMCPEGQQRTSIAQLMRRYALEFHGEACSVVRTDEKDAATLSEKDQMKGAKKARRINKEVILCLN